MISYVELNESIQKAFSRKIVGGHAKVQPAPEECISGLKHTSNTLKTHIRYFSLIEDDDEIVARKAINQTRKLLKAKLNKSIEIKPLSEKDIAGVKFGLAIIDAQHKFAKTSIRR